MTAIFPTTWTTAKGETRTAFRITYYIAGKKRFKQFKTERAAQRFIKRRLSHTINSEERDAATQDSTTIKNFAKTWLDACESGRSGELPLEPETIRTYGGYINNWIIPDLGKERIATLKRSSIVKFRDDLLANNSISRLTAKKILTCLKSILGYAIEMEEIELDPSTRINIKTGGRHAKQINIHTKVQMARIIAKSRALANSENKRDRRVWTRYALMLELLVYCGLRLSELRGLPRRACDVEQAKLSVVQRADRSGRIGPPKSVRGRRTLYMPETTNKHLKDWLQTHRHDLVFPSPTGRPLFPENIRKRMWQHIQQAADVPEYNLHATRHFFASRLIEKGVNLKELSTDMGHADEAFTLRVYGHLFRDPESERKRRQRANALTFKASRHDADD